MHISEIPPVEDGVQSTRSLTPQQHLVASVLKQERAHQKPNWDSRRPGDGACKCTDHVVRVCLPVDGDHLRYGFAYKVAVRATDEAGNRWSGWSEPSPPVQLEVRVPRVAVPQHAKVSVQLVAGRGGTSGVQVHLSWPPFASETADLQYRVLLWTLDEDQVRRAQDTRLGKPSALPLIASRETIMVSPDDAVPARAPNAAACAALCGLPPIVERGRAGHRAARVHKTSDEPQVVAHITPKEPPPYPGARRTPRALARGGGGAQVAQQELVRPPEVTADVEVVVPGAYVFAVECRPARGDAGVHSHWSAPVYSPLVAMEMVKTELSVRVGARYGGMGMLWRGEAATGGKHGPLDECVQLDAHAVPWMEEQMDYGDLPTPDGVLDTWAPRGIVPRAPPERRPLRDDLRPR